MTATTTSGETLRSPLDGTELIRLATAGANWKAQTGNQTWVFGGIAGGSVAASTLTLESTTAAGVGDFIKMFTGSQVERMRWDGLGNIVKNNGGASPVAFSTTISGIQDTPQFQILDATRASSIFAIARWNAGTNSCKIIMATNRAATVGLLNVAAQSGDEAGGILYNFSDGTLFQNGGYIAGFCDGTPSTNVMFGRISIWTNGGGIASTERLRVESNGQIDFTNTTGFGYGIAGNADGGTVTQLTSKSTGVTLNTVNGQITMVNSALGGTTTVSFTLTNSKIAANDYVYVQHQSGGTQSGAYQVWVDTLAAGSCVVNVRNMTGGSLSEAIVIGFFIVKGTIT